MIFTRTRSARGALALAAIGLAACSDRIPTRDASGTSAILMGIFGTSARDVWAVGYDGIIVHGTR